MYNKAGYTIVGIFVLIFGTGMVWFAFWLNKSTGSEVFNTYTLHMKDSVSGLSKDAAVKLHGVNVGRVKKIEINPVNIEEVLIVVEVESEIPLKSDMIAHTQMVGVTGMLAIEIDGGSNQARTLENGATLQTKPSFFSTISENAGPMVEDISSLVKKADIILKKSEVLFSEENTQNIAKILTNIAYITSRADVIEKRLFHSLDEADKTVNEARTFMQTLKPALLKSTKNFTTIQKDFHAVSKESLPLIKKLKSTTVKLNRIMIKVERSIDRGEYNMKKILEPMLIDVQMLMKQISNISRSLQQNPSDLLFKSKKHRRAPGE